MYPKICDRAHLPQPEHAGHWQEAVRGTVAQTSEAEPSRSCSSPTSESTVAAATRSGRIVIEPTRLDQDADYVEQLPVGPLRDKTDEPRVQGPISRTARGANKDDGFGMSTS